MPRSGTVSRTPRYSDPSILRPQPQIPPLIADAFVAPRAGLSGTAAVRQLADDMRQAGHREGGVTRDDLELIGWTPAQLDTHASDARARAQSLSGMSA